MIALIIFTTFSLVHSQDIIFTDVIHTEYGQVRGMKRVLDDNVGIIDSYLGIPYAAPPIQERRFRHPEPPTPWFDVYNATDFPNMCQQLQVIGPFVSDEDCLYLNIVVPNTETANKAVMVWIYGGGFVSGDINTYDAGYLAAFNDVIVVNVAYRLGALGFMSLEIEGVPGNAGMMDQVFALEWVQRNIANFGGDPKKVTIFGESAGAASVGFHLVSPLSQNLFKGAILQSGDPTAFWAYLPRHINQQSSVEITKDVGCGDLDSSQVLECLLAVPATDFLPNVESISEYHPTLITEDGHFLLEPPGESLQNGKFNKVPILAGSNTNEGSIFVANYLPEYLNLTIISPKMNSTQFIDSIKTLFTLFTVPGGISEAGIDAILFEFTNWEDIEDDAANVAQLDYAYGNAGFVCGGQRMADVYADADQDVYFYQFTHRYENHFYPEWIGVAHADDLFVLFDFPNYDINLNFTSEERQFSFDVMKHWANFAKSGDPNIDDDGEVMASKWPLYTKGIRQYKDLNAEWMYEPESIKSGSLRPHQCAFFEHYLPQVEEGCP